MCVCSVCRIARHKGKVSKSTLSILIEDKFVYVEFHQIDMYGRIIGIVYCDKILGQYINNVNMKMVSLGYAWWYEEYSNDSEYAKLQAEAKLTKLGLWKGENPIPPWEFRKIKKNKGK